MSSKIKSFQVRTPDMIPEKSTNSERQGLGISDWFLAKTETISGNTSWGVVAYFYERKEWRVIQAGMEKVIEYYVEVTEPTSEQGGEA